MTTERSDPKLHHGTRLVAVVVVVLLCLGVTTAIVSAIQVGISGEEIANQLPILGAVLGFGLLGAVILMRQPRNAMGWLFAAVGLLGALVSPELLIEHVLSRTEGPPPVWAMVGAWYQEWSFTPLIALIILFIPLFFPTGRLPSPRWRPLLWLASTSVVVATVPRMFRERLDGAGYDIANPVGIRGGTELAAIANEVTEVGLLLSALGVAVAVIVRFRRSRGAERQQLKAFAFATGAALLLLVVERLISAAIPIPYVVEIVGGLVFLAIPLTAGLAVLRYRLYDIDRVISRTVSYGLVTLTLAGVYVLGVVGLGGLVRGIAGGGGGDLVVAASTLSVAAAFGPVRRRVQEVVDRRFNRARYDASREVERFGACLRDEVDLTMLEHELAGTARATLQPAHAGLWMPPIVGTER